jgi:hypothetical protein
MLEEAAVAKLEVLSRNFSGGIEENYGNSQSGYPVSEPNAQ